jgi:iron(III) transport system permease protein
MVISIAFVYAYALTRTCMRFKGFFKIMAMVPLLSPSLLKAIALIMASVFWTFPHAVLVISTAPAISDMRLYEAADTLKASRVRTFFMVTLPGACYGLISSTIVVCSLIFTYFGVPKVIGGNYNVLATDIYKEVLGQQNFEMGAVVSVVLLTPALLAFVIDRLVTRKQTALLSARAVPFVPKPNRWLDGSMLTFCVLITLLTMAILGMAQFAALIKFWPYNLGFTLEHYAFDLEGSGWDNFFNYLIMAGSVAIFGAAIVFTGAFLIDKPRRDSGLRQVFQFVALLPMAIPGLVLGLAYLFFINDPDNPLGFLYGTIVILIVNCLTHFYTVSHLTAMTSLKQMDREFESVSTSLKVPLMRSYMRVTVPVCMPTILDVSMYLFLSSMTTVSTVIFLYGPTAKVASVAAIHLAESGESAVAAAMAMLIVYACIVVRIAHAFASGWLLKRIQGWR